MAETEILHAESRTEFGKGAARRIRRANKIPGVIYGHGTDPVHLSLPGHETMMALQHGGANAVVEIQYEGGSQLALTKQVQSDPIKGFIEHVDFVAVRRGEKVTVDIPVQVVGESRPDALTVTEHGEISIEAEATHIPEAVEVSVQDAEAGFQIFARDLPLPGGVSLLTDEDTLVVNVTHAPTAAEIEAELEEAEAEVGIEHELSDEEQAEAGAGADTAESSEAGGTEGAGSGEDASSDEG